MVGELRHNVNVSELADVESKETLPVPVARTASLVLAAIIALVCVGGLAFTLVFWFFLATPPVSDVLSGSEDLRAGWIGVMAVPAAVFIIAIVRFRAAVDPPRQRRALRLWFMLVAQPIVLGLTAWLSSNGASIGSEVPGSPRLQLVSPARGLWIVVALQAALIGVDRVLAKSDLRTWQVALRAPALGLLIAVFLVPVAATPTCYQPVPDRMLYPLPVGVQVIEDKQDNARFSHDPPFYRRLVVRSPGMDDSALEQLLVQHFADAGWTFKRWGPPNSPAFSAKARNWTLSVGDSGLTFDPPPPDGLEVELVRYGGFCYD